MDFLEKISITCFAASYAVVLALEIVRQLWPNLTRYQRARKFVKLGFAVAGLIAHTAFLLIHGGLHFDVQGLWLGNWYGWCLATSWLLAVSYLWIKLRQRETILGLFLLPIVLGLIGMAIQFGPSHQFSASHARTIWNMIHGIALLVGTAVVALGCVFGGLYLWQAYRLKHKTASAGSVRLPSLEWLQHASERALIASASLLGIGLIAGIGINQTSVSAATGEPSVAWTNPVIWSSGILFAWLLASTLFNLFYQPARQGRKVAYLVITSFLFLILELGVVWWAGHAT